MGTKGVLALLGLKRNDSMKSQISTFLIATISLFFVVSAPAIAEGLTVDNTMITQVSVNGGTDSINAGTTCLQISSSVSGACASGFIAIPNNNKQLLSAVLTAKSTGSKVWIYYENNASVLHCPGIVLTPCSLISVSLK